MNFKRAIGIIFVMCVAVLIVTIILGKLLNIDLKETDPHNLPLNMWYSAIISVVILIGIGAIWYFKSPKTIPCAKNGFLFGLYACIFGFVCDILLLIPYSKGADILLQYYTQPNYWIPFILILIVCTSVGAYKGQRIK